MATRLKGFFIKLFCLSGLPRSGSTWLGAILNQNPDCYVTGQSPFVELLWRNYSLWKDSNWKQDFIADNLECNMVSYLRGITELYYRQLTDCGVVIDNRRHWQSITNIMMHEDIFGSLPKIICPVRRIEDIVASFLKLYRNNNKEFNLDVHLNGNVFLGIHSMLEATYNSHYRDCLHLVDYENLVSNTDYELERIYSFIDMPNYKHDYECIKQNNSLRKVDSEYGLVGMHEIKSGVQKSNTVAEIELNKEQLIQYRELNFWE